MDIPEGASIVGVVSSCAGSKIFSLTENGYGKITDGTEYRLTSRGTKGVKTVKEGEKNGKLIAIRTVKGDEDIILITDQGTTLRTSLSQIRETSRNTVGVKVITLRDRENISSCTVLPSESEYEATEPESPVDTEALAAAEARDDAALDALLARAEDSDDDSSEE